LRKINVRDFRRATRSTSREINRQIALNLVHEHQPISRADLARMMGIRRGMATGLVNELLDERLIYEGEAGESSRGRKPTLLYVRTHDRLAIAIDIRFSRTHIMLADFAGSEIAVEAFPTIYEPDALIEELRQRIDRLLHSHAVEGRIEGIGVVVPGMVDQRTGSVLNSPQLGWHDVRFRDGLAKATNQDVQIENAPIACALAQMWLGQRGGEGLSNFVYVTVSDGVGAGIVVDGRLMRGATWTAGEFGHIPLDANGPECLCGARGCWEALTSNLATLARYRGHEMSPDEAKAILRERDLTVPDLIRRARTGNAKAREAIIETGRYLGRGISVIVNTVNPQRIFVGGEITGAWDLIDRPIREAIAQRALSEAAAATPIIPETSEFPRLRGATALVAAPMFAAPQVG
jgi:predicted NBD/HSP70 family sugar kinase